MRKGGLSLLANKDEPIFRGYILPDQPEFFVIFFKLLSVKIHDKLIELGRHASFLYGHI